MTGKRGRHSGQGQWKLRNTEFPEVNKAWQGPSSLQSTYKKLGSYYSVLTSEKLTIE